LSVQISVWSQSLVSATDWAKKWSHPLSLAPVNPDWFYLPGFTFLVPAHPGSPGQNPESRKTGVAVVVVTECGVTVKSRVASRVEREIRTRWYNLGTTAKQIAMIWACAAKRRQRLGEETYEAWSEGCQTRYTKKIWTEVV